MPSQNFFIGNLKPIITLLILVILIPVVVFGGSRAVEFFSRAAPISAKIVIDAKGSQGILKRPWEGLSQGGEQEEPGKLVDFGVSSDKIKKLGVRFIRIDHVLDNNFPYRDRVEKIVKMGATPIIALSYFPKNFSGGDVGEYENPEIWKQKVKQLVEEVSGRGEGQLNLSGVYYEVWNEPDGPTFGKFNIGQGKDYFILYRDTVEAIESAQNVNSFKIAGPSLADLRRCTNGGGWGICASFWLDKFLELVEKNNVRLDAITWHRYATKISDYHEDVNFILEVSKKYPNLPRTEKIITEYGSKPERDAVHSQNFDAAHLILASASFVGEIDMATKFEIVDGPDSGNEGWGILTHDNKEKPVYYAFALLKKLRSERLALNGTGTFVGGIASKDRNGYSVLLANFDPKERNVEKVPVTINSLPNGDYRLRKYSLGGKPADCEISNWNSGKCQTKVVISNGVWQNSGSGKIPGELMPANSVLLYDLELVSRS